MKFIHAADLHLGQGQRGEAKGRASSRELFFLVFEDLLQLAEDEKVDLLLLAGDILESQKIAGDDVKRIRDLLKRPRSFGILAVAGNHDPLNENSPWPALAEGLSDFYLFSSQEVERIDIPSFDLSIYGTSFARLYEAPGLMPCQTNLAKVRTTLGYKGLGDGLQKGHFVHDLKTPPLGKRLGLIHGDLGGEMTLEQASQGHSYNRLTPEDFRHSDLHYVALGHFHTQSEIYEAGMTQYAYSGTPQGAGFDELGERGVLLGEWTGRKPELKPYTLCRSRYELVKVPLTSITDDAAAATRVLETLQEQDEAHYQDHRYKIQLVGERDEAYRPDPTAIQMRLEPELTYCEIQDLSKPALDIAKLVQENTLRGAFVKALLEAKSSFDDELMADQKDELFDLALRYGLEGLSTEGEIIL